MSHHSLQQGDRRGDRRKHHQQVEQDAEDGAQTAHAAEHVLHGDKQQLGAAQRAGGIQGETAGDDAQAGHQRHQRIHDDDENGVFLEVLLLIQIGAVGDHNAHAQRQGEEHLTAGGGKHGQEIGGFFDDAVGHSPARNEHVLQAIHRAGQGAGADNADQQHHEQRGHAHGTNLLDTAADAAHDDEHGQRHKDETVDNGLSGVAHKGVEYLCAQRSAVGRSHLRKGGGAEAGAEQIAHVHHHVLDAVAAQCAVEEQNKERGQDAQPAQPLEALAQHMIRADHALAGLAAQRQLAHHDDKAAQNGQHQIHDQEGKTAGGAHFIGEAPDVAQADCRTDRRHQESKIGSKAFSFFHCFLSLLNTFP